MSKVGAANRLANQFPIDVRQREVEVNTLLQRSHPDADAGERRLALGEHRHGPHALAADGAVEREHTVWGDDPNVSPSSVSNVISFTRGLPWNSSTEAGR